ncbi:hypothetical protein Bca4012_009957 [Brassica carinata]
MKRKTTEGESSDTYQSFAKATKADLYIAPHNTLNHIPTKQALASAVNKPVQNRKVSYTTVEGTRPITTASGCELRRDADS